jgi:hypothetical protein
MFKQWVFLTETGSVRWEVGTKVSYMYNLDECKYLVKEYFSAYWPWNYSDWVAGLRNTLSWIYLLLSRSTLVSVIKAVFFYNVITCSDTAAVSAWPWDYKDDKEHWLRVLPAS